MHAAEIGIAALGKRAQQIEGCGGLPVGLDLPMRIDIRTPTGDVVKDRPMWTYWNLQEGEISVDPVVFATADGGAPPVIHLDTDAPLYTDDGVLVTNELESTARALATRGPRTASSYVLLCRCQ